MQEPEGQDARENSKGKCSNAKDARVLKANRPSWLIWTQKQVQTDCEDVRVQDAGMAEHACVHQVN